MPTPPRRDLCERVDEDHAHRAAAHDCFREIERVVHLHQVWWSINDPNVQCRRIDSGVARVPCNTFAEARSSFSRAVDDALLLDAVASPRDASCDGAGEIEGPE